MAGECRPHDATTGPVFHPESRLRSRVPGSGGAVTGESRWLAIDTGTDLASVAVGAPPGFDSSTQLTGQRAHAAAIVELVDRCLRPLGRKPGDLVGVVVGDGPGGFTGLRIGWEAAKGFARGAGRRRPGSPGPLPARPARRRAVGPV